MRLSCTFNLILGLLFCTSVSASEVVVLPVNIQGLEYQIELKDNSSFSSKVITEDKAISGVHYAGSVMGVDNSWARASLVGNRWQGVVSIHGAMHMFEYISSGTGDVAAAISSMDSTPMAEVEGLKGSCGSGDHSHSMLSHFNKLKVMSNASSSSLIPALAAATFAEFCMQEINGICVIAEIEIAFDLEFQNVFGAQALAQAMSILNIVDGHYINDLKISIDAITLEMLSNDLFNTSFAASPILDAGAVLDDIENMKNNALIPFVTNNSALTHLVTGRDFNGGTLGVAYVGSVCQANGFSTGTSSVFYSNPANTATYNIPLTAVVIAHELAHNLGSLHDGVPEPNGNPLCPANTYIMSPGIGPSLSLTNFSQCSAEDIEMTLSSLTNPEQCLDFPVDIYIDENTGNSGPLDVNSRFVSSYTASINNGYIAVDRVDINGAINPAEGLFINVAANGNNCLIAAGGGSYTCSVLNPPTAFNIAVITQVNNAISSVVNVTQIANEQTADVQEVNNANNTLTSSFTIENGNVESSVSTTSMPPVSVPDSTTTPATNSSDEGGGAGNLGYGIIVIMLISLFRHTCLYKRAK